jgi:3-deoxy-7-phosphoheptulonate synthase
VTDGCISWDESVKVLEGLAAAVRQRRLVDEQD